jgi:hypothetical protein
MDLEVSQLIPTFLQLIGTTPFAVLPHVRPRDANHLFTYLSENKLSWEGSCVSNNAQWGKWSCSLMRKINDHLPPVPLTSPWWVGWRYFWMSTRACVYRPNTRTTDNLTVHVNPVFSCHCYPPSVSTTVRNNKCRVHDSVPGITHCFHSRSRKHLTSLFPWLWS